MRSCRCILSFILKLRFIIALVGNRDLIWRGKPLSAEQIAHSCPMLYAEWLIREKESEEAVYLGVRTRLEILAMRVLKAAKRIFGIPKFRYYALGDGIHEILAHSAQDPLRPKSIGPPSPQLFLFDP